MKFEMSWTTKDGRRIEGQIYTAQFVTVKLIELEESGARNIEIKSID